MERADEYALYIGSTPYVFLNQIAVYSQRLQRLRLNAIGTTATIPCGINSDIA